MLSRRFMISVGSTREPADAIRLWTNVFTGDSLLPFVRRLSEHGSVDLLSSSAAHAAALRELRARVEVSQYGSTSELRALMQAKFESRAYDCVFLAAAVADYRPAGMYQVIERVPGPDGRETWTVQRSSSPKTPSSFAELAALATPTEKLVDLVRAEFGHRGLLVKYKLEVGVDTPTLLRIASRAREASRADYLVANTLEMARGERPGAFLIGGGDPEWLEREALQQRLCEIARSTRTA